MPGPSPTDATDATPASATTTPSGEPLGGRAFKGVTDPTYVPPANPGPFARTALALIRDPRDLPFVWHILGLTAYVAPCVAVIYWPGHLRRDGFEGTWPAWLWGFSTLYLVVLFAALLSRYILMLHNTSHRVLFHNEWLNHYIPWVLGPFFGETPETYFSHHVGMHHPENNLEGDLSSTMRYQRDSALGFAHYYLSFMTTGLYQLSRYHLAKASRRKLGVRAIVGELGFYAASAALLAWNWRATLVVFVIPVVLVRLLMMLGNWGQHAFIDPARPDNCYVNSITCINTPYNHAAFNDGYHIGHHLKQSRHFSEMPSDFLANVDRYAKEGAIVFEGLDFFLVSVCLLLGRYDWLARRYVRLDDTPRTEADIIALLKSRTRPIVRTEEERAPKRRRANKPATLDEPVAAE